jgi:SAM-dependent methyltransferase
LSERAFSEHTRLEFTGERVVPGLVDADLLNEHLARYRFAARFAEGAMVLDAGCGTGYGAAELSRASQVVGVDASTEAVAHARLNFSGAGVHFFPAVCEALPFADGSFDLVVAFEVIEHLERWQDFLAEARRVLRPGGLLLVSTPNKAYYAEMRGAAGANPYHVREFEFDEFEAALREVFPHVRLWTQNHSDAIVFNLLEHSAGDFDVRGDDRPEQAHFFLAACGMAPIADARAFAWSPVSGNVLRDRERHIGLLESELKKKDEWLEQTHAAHATLQEGHEQLLAELERSNEWADQLNAELTQAGGTIAGLQQELAITHAGYRENERQLAAELAETHAGYRENERQLEAELAGTHAGYREEVRQLEAELATTHAGYQANERRLAAELAAELAGTHAGYQEQMRQVEAELAETHAGYQERLREVEVELAGTHAGYRKKVGQLEEELATAHAGYREAVRALEADLAATHAGYREKVRELEADLLATHAGYQQKVGQLETELAVRLEWVHNLESQVERLGRELIERTQWAQSLQGDLAEREDRLRLAANSKWVRLGRRLHLGPEIVTGSGQPE